MFKTNMTMVTIHYNTLSTSIYYTIHYVQFQGMKELFYCSLSIAHYRCT